MGGDYQKDAVGNGNINEQDRCQIIIVLKQTKLSFGLFFTEYCSFDNQCETLHLASMPASVSVIFIMPMLF